MQLEYHLPKKNIGRAIPTHMIGLASYLRIHLLYNGPQKFFSLESFLLCIHVHVRYVYGKATSGVESSYVPRNIIMLEKLMI